MEGSHCAQPALKECLRHEGRGSINYLHLSFLPRLFFLFDHWSIQYVLVTVHFIPWAVTQCCLTQTSYLWPSGALPAGPTRHALSVFGVCVLFFSLPQSWNQLFLQGKWYLKQSFIHIYVLCSLVPFIPVCRSRLPSGIFCFHLKSISECFLYRYTVMNCFSFYIFFIFAWYRILGCQGLGGFLVSLMYSSLQYF